MPDGSVLLVDDVCHHSGEVPVGAFCRVAGAGSACPCALSALEEHNFLFQLQAPERPPEDAKEGLEVPLVAVIQWSTPKLPFTSSIYTHYRLPSIRLERPRFVMTAACESPVRARQRFTVTYTLLNDLQDFLAVRLVWTPETATAGGQPARGEGLVREGGFLWGSQKGGWRWPRRGQLAGGGLLSPPPCREETVWGGTSSHAGGAGRHRLPHAAQQPGLLAQGQRPHHPSGLPSPAGWPLRGEATGHPSGCPRPPPHPRPGIPHPTLSPLLFPPSCPST
uniref:Microtubule associated protein 11 n=1 Tax=Calidris pygmaea TaxID=425635 RepID=A0A8C3J415_9CHAR